MMSPRRRSTSPRAGAGVLRHSSNPRRADSTARSTSAAPDSGNRPIVSERSAGLRFSKYSPPTGETQSPPMKFLNDFMSPVVCEPVENGAGAVIILSAEPHLGMTARPRIDSAVSFAHPAGWMVEVRLGITDTRQHLDGAKDEAPENQEQREGVRLVRAMAPSPHRAPDAAGDHDPHRREIAGQTDAATRRVRPQYDPHTKQHGKQEPGVYAPRRRSPRLARRGSRRLLAPRVALSAGRALPARCGRRRSEQCVVGERRE